MMIESKSQLVDDFRTKADAFLAAPSVGSGIAFDDAAVTLKRYVLTEMHDQALASPWECKLWHDNTLRIAAACRPQAAG